MNTVYVAMCADVVHRGHINILREASKYGRVIVGLLSDQAVSSFKRVPFLTYEDRHAVISNLRWVDEVVQQDATTPAPYLRQLKPTYFVHGDDWCNSKENFVRDRVIEALDSYGGKLVEAPYTQGVSSSQIQQDLRATERKLAIGSRRLRMALDAKSVTRAYCSSNFDQALAASQATAGRRSFDAVWLALPADIDLLDMNPYFDLVENTEKPALLDCRRLNNFDNLPKLVERAPRLGVSGLCLHASFPSSHREIWKKINETAGREYLMLTLAGDYSSGQSQATYLTEGADILIDTGGIDPAKAFSEINDLPEDMYLGLSVGDLQFDESAFAQSPLHFLLYDNQNTENSLEHPQEILVSNDQMMT